MSTNNNKPKYPKVKSAKELLFKLGHKGGVALQLIDPVTGKLNRDELDVLGPEGKERVIKEFNKYKKDPDKPATPDNLKFGMKKDYHPNGKVNKVKYT